jgi:nitrate reductase gamma subunit
MANVPWIYKIHVVCGFAIFGFFPYTRLIHAIAIPYQYFYRRYIVYRRRPRV